MSKTPNTPDLFEYNNSAAVKPCAASGEKTSTPLESSHQPLATKSIQSPVNDRIYLRVEDVAARYDVSIATIWRWASETANAFPKPIQLSRGTTRWLLGELENYDAQVKADRDGSNG
ncbi:helix-turn-helix transcriptional regulator [Paramylibacter kogurei]|uniref:helix-turn-helix transcriptional regulator n=1 Tax=Paramylibacter kogurei TaxID=1889778 RepID=UPI000DF2A64B|nr:AlpA family phage regulatory protein [Amylibacter kogurei]